MQLRAPRGRRRTAGMLGLLAANLLAAHAAHAGDVAQGPDGTDPARDLMSTPANGVGTTIVDSAVLFYQEQGGRVQAIEPTTSLTVNRSNGDVVSARFTYDALTGATPNGAAPWTGPQTFTTPTHVSAGHQTTTGASGQTVVTDPGTGAVVSQYTAPANRLPVDRGFMDHRYAGELGYSRVVDSDTKLSFGGAVSVESDYRSYAANAGVSRDFNGKNTTLSLDGNFEYDESRPLFGTPTPLTPMSGLPKGPPDKKTVLSMVGGVTQVINRRWLVQLNYSFGSNRGYQTDPYRILSVVNPMTGAPVDYLYESRPRSRFRQSVYFGNKISLGPTVADLSARYYHDNWGIDSITAEISEQIPVGHAVYIQPGYRYYRQSAADFFRYYLLSGVPLPRFASSDSRLCEFQAHAIDLKLGIRILDRGELYILGEDYLQIGRSHSPNAPGALAREDLFSGINAISVMTGFKYSFR